MFLMLIHCVLDNFLDIISLYYFLQLLGIVIFFHLLAVLHMTCDKINSMNEINKGKLLEKSPQYAISKERTQQEFRDGRDLLAGFLWFFFFFCSFCDMVDIDHYTKTLYSSPRVFISLSNLFHRLQHVPLAIFLLKKHLKNSSEWWLDSIKRLIHTINTFLYCIIYPKISST